MHAYCLSWEFSGLRPALLARAVQTVQATYGRDAASLCVQLNGFIDIYCAGTETCRQRNKKIKIVLQINLSNDKSLKKSHERNDHTR